MAISPPPGYVQDTNDPSWYYDPTKDISANDPSAWWQHPPEGYVQDENDPDWWYDPTKDIKSDPSAWHNTNPALIDDPATMSLNFWTFEEIGQAAQVAAHPNIAENWPHLCHAAGEWGLEEPLILIGFVGTIAKETGSFYPVREAWWIWDKDRQAAINYYNNTNLHAAYQGGWQYHGRGYTQNTHLGAYQQATADLQSKGMNVDLVNNPDLLLVPEYAAHAMCSFFIRKPGLLAACRGRNWPEVRRLVWGAYGDANGVAKLQHAESVLLPLAQSRGFA